MRRLPTIVFPYLAYLTFALHLPPPLLAAATKLPNDSYGLQFDFYAPSDLATVAMEQTRDRMCLRYPTILGKLGLPRRRDSLSLNVASSVTTVAGSAAC